jgi:hypothetical protein
MGGNAAVDVAIALVLIYFSSSSLNRGVVRASIGCLLGLTASGCAYVEETQRDGTVSRSVVPFPLIQSSSPANQGSVVKATGMGLAILNGTTTLGWFDASTVALDPSCRIVLVGNTDEQLRKFVELTGGAREVCGGNASGGARQ